MADQESLGGCKDGLVQKHAVGENHHRHFYLEFGGCHVSGQNLLFRTIGMIFHNSYLLEWINTTKQKKSIGPTKFVGYLHKRVVGLQNIGCKTVLVLSYQPKLGYYAPMYFFWILKIIQFWLTYFFSHENIWWLFSLLNTKDLAQLLGIWWCNRPSCAPRQEVTVEMAVKMFVPWAKKDECNHRQRLRKLKEKHTPTWV